MDIWLGTTNKGKVTEMSMILAKEMPELLIKTLNDLPHYTQPPENGSSFLENARIKAKSLKSMTAGSWSLAEDSGLEVAALNNLPGIHSARYAGPHARDSENVAKLLKMLQIKGAMDRSARFYCSLVAYSPEGQEFVVEGQMKGVINKTPVGQMGFGYDPVFVPEGEQKTLAELGPAFKIRASHRAQAVMALIQQIRSTSP
jgi:XTP/dITP diphosphohydrolase